MKKLSKENKIVIVIFVCILLLQIVIMVCATNKREYYHIDELYSQGLMQYKRAFIFENEDFLNQWHDSQYFEEYLSIQEEEKWDFSAVYQNQIEDVHPPVYYFFLRIANMFHIGEFSIWPGTILNIILYALSMIVLYKISREIFKSPYTALLVCFVNGCAIGTIETVMYVRMYQFLILHILLLIYWHIKNKDKEHLMPKQLIPLAIMVVFGFLTHYYYAIIVVVLWIMFMIYYWKKKQIHNAFVYTTTMLGAGLLAILFFPYAINHIFFGYRGQEVMNNMFQIENMLGSILENIKIIRKELFNGYLNILLVGTIILCSICLGYMIYQKKRNLESKQPETSENLKYVAIPMIMYLLIVAIASPYRDLRYIMPVIPLVFLSIVYILQNILEMMIDKKTTLILLIVISISFFGTLIPKIGNNTYTYKRYAQAKEILTSDYTQIPWIYVYEVVPINFNKTMECYGVLTKVKQTFIMDNRSLSVPKIEQAIQEKDISKGIILLVHKQSEENAISTIMATGKFTQYKAKCMLGRYIVYYFK